jgi:hypothetical protein
MQELIRIKFRLTIEFFGRFRKAKLIHFEYEQASFRDLIEMQRKINDDDSLRKWLLNFLMEKTKQSDKLTVDLFNQLSTFEINSIMEFLFKTYAKGFFEKEKSSSSKRGKKSPDSSLICTILEKTNETVESLLDMTWDQIKFLSEGITWNLNAQSKKGEQANQRHLRMKELKESFSDKDTDAALKGLNERILKRNLKK